MLLTTRHSTGRYSLVLRKAASSHSMSACVYGHLPDSVECCANTAMMPVSRFAPDLLEKYLSPASANACSIMREVVVLPFVPVTTVTFTPRDSSPRIFLSIFSASLPGRLVPPRPSLRRTAPDALHTSTASLVWSFIVVTSFFKSYKISIAHFAALHKGKCRES